MLTNALTNSPADKSSERPLRRAVMASPQVLLLDEPFSALDAATRTAMQQLFLRLSAIHRLTCVLVTHDIREALAAGSEFCRMHDGQLLQYPGRRAFISDEATGVHDELQFCAVNCLRKRGCRRIQGSPRATQQAPERTQNGQRLYAVR